MQTHAPTRGALLSKNKDKKRGALTVTCSDSLPSAEKTTTKAPSGTQNALSRRERERRRKSTEGNPMARRPKERRHRWKDTQGANPSWQVFPQIQINVSLHQRGRPGWNRSLFRPRQRAGRSRRAHAPRVNSRGIRLRLSMIDCLPTARDTYCDTLTTTEQPGAIYRVHLETAYTLRTILSPCARNNSHRGGRKLVEATGGHQSLLFVR